MFNLEFWHEKSKAFLLNVFFVDKCIPPMSFVPESVVSISNDECWSMRYCRPFGEI